MDLEDKAKYSVFTKRGTKIQTWKKEEINSGVFSESELESYLKLYDSHRWETIEEKEKGSIKKYTLRSIPHPESEEAEKRKNFLYHLFSREDYMHIKIIKE